MKVSRLLLASSAALAIAIPAGAESQRVAMPPAAPAAPAELTGIEAFIERGMKDWEIPGLSIAVVRNDSLVYARGFGVRGVNDPRPVDEHTLFGVASVSKAFTAAALGMLVDEGRVSWDDPVIRHLPQFQLYDPYVTRTVTIRDLLSHRIGVGRITGNRLRWLTYRPRSELIERIRHLGPEQTFRNGHVYSNVMYMVAGEIVPAVTGENWEDFVRSRIFQPLGMSRSISHSSHLAANENVVLPHQEIDGVVVEIPRRSFDAVGPAASIYSSATEIAEWMRFHLGDPGVHNGRRLVNRATMAEMHRAQSILRESDFGALSSYGLGWSISTYEGRRTSRHGGAVDGMNSLVVLVPAENLGIFISTNTFNDFTTSVANRVMDAYFGLPARDWHAVVFEAYERRKAQVQQQRQAIHDARITGTTPSVPLTGFTGRFHDPLYADAEVRLDGGRLVLQLWGDDEQIADLEHWHHDTFRAIWRNRAQREEFVFFTRGADGAIAELNIEWNLRPALLQVGAYPSGYTRVATFKRVPDTATDHE